MKLVTGVIIVVLFKWSYNAFGFKKSYGCRRMNSVVCTGKCSLCWNKDLESLFLTWID